jgi:plastocyanin
MDLVSPLQYATAGEHNFRHTSAEVHKKTDKNEETKMKKILLTKLSLITLTFMLAISMTRFSFAAKQDEIEQTTSSQNNQTDKDQINIVNFTFTPSTLTIPTGTKVTWINHDDIPHIVRNTEKRFVSPVLDTDDKFSFTFTTPGTYDYYCSIHPVMTAKIIVK